MRGFMAKIDRMLNDALKDEMEGAYFYLRLANEYINYVGKIGDSDLKIIKKLKDISEEEAGHFIVIEEIMEDLNIPIKISQKEMEQTAEKIRNISYQLEIREKGVPKSLRPEYIENHMY